MLNFDILDKGLGRVSPAHFVHDFPTKMCLMLYFVAWLSLLLEILSNMCIAILVNQVVTSWILKLALCF